MAEHSSTDNVHTRKIAEFVSGVRYEQIPADVRERLKLLILDSLGCAHLRRQSGMVPDSPGHVREARRDPHDLGLGHQPRLSPRPMPRW